MTTSFATPEAPAATAAPLPRRSDRRRRSAGRALLWVLPNTSGLNAHHRPADFDVNVRGVRVNARDGAALSDIETLRVTAIEDSEIVLVDAA